MHARNDLLDLGRLPFPLLVSEKLDGWRCLVAGNELLTKTAGRFPNRNLRSHLADALRLSTMGHCLDGELWSPEMSLEEIQSVLQSAAAEIPDHLQLYVFDCLTLGELLGSRAARYERRFQRYAALIAEHSPAYVVAHGQQIAEGPTDLVQLYESTIAAGGEGLMLRNPAGSYRRGRIHASDRIAWKMKPATIASAHGFAARI